MLLQFGKKPGVPVLYRSACKVKINRFARTLGFERLELRNLPSIVTSDLKAIGDSLESYITANPGNAVGFERLLKKEFTENVVDRVVKFVNNLNPIPGKVQDFLNAPIGGPLEVGMDFIDQNLGGIDNLIGFQYDPANPSRTSPKNLIIVKNRGGAIGDEETLGMSLGWLLKTQDAVNLVNSAKSAANISTTDSGAIGVYDQLFSNLKSLFQIDSFGIVESADSGTYLDVENQRIADFFQGDIPGPAGAKLCGR